MTWTTAKFDLVAALFGTLSPLSRVVYILVGLAAVYRLLQWKSIEHRRSFCAGGKRRTVSP